MIRKILITFAAAALLAAGAFVWLASRGASGDSAEVYAAYIDGKLPVREIKYGPPHPIYVANRTTSQRIGAFGDWWTIRKRLIGVSPVAFANMLLQANSSHAVALPDPRFQSLDPSAGGEEPGIRLGRQNPVGFHYFQFSAAGFDVSGTQAVFHVLYTCGQGCGDGNYVLMARREGKWVVVRRSNTWIATLSPAASPAASGQTSPR